MEPLATRARPAALSLRSVRYSSTRFRVSPLAPIVPIMLAAISCRSACASRSSASLIMRESFSIFARASVTETSRAFSRSRYALSASASCWRFSSSCSLTVRSWRAYCPAAAVFPALRCAAAFAASSRSWFSRFFTWRIRRSQKPAWFARFSLKREICFRRFSFSTSRSALGLARSIPVMKSPRNPRNRFAILLNIRKLTPFCHQEPDPGRQPQPGRLRRLGSLARGPLVGYCGDFVSDSQANPSATSMDSRNVLKLVQRASAIAVFCLIACVPTAPARAADRTLVLRGATVLPVDGPPIPAGAIVVVGGKISAVGPPEGVEIPAEAEVLDLSGKTVIPGLVDTHSHLGLYPRPSVEANSDGNETTGPT